MMFRRLTGEKIIQVFVSRRRGIAGAKIKAIALTMRSYLGPFP